MGDDDDKEEVEEDEEEEEDGNGDGPDEVRGNCCDSDDELISSRAGFFSSRLGLRADDTAAENGRDGGDRGGEEDDISI